MHNEFEVTKKIWNFNSCLYYKKYISIGTVNELRDKIIVLDYKFIYDSDGFISVKKQHEQWSIYYSDKMKISSILEEMSTKNYYIKCVRQKKHELMFEVYKIKDK